MKKLLIALAVSSFLSTTVFATTEASFDCNKASTKVEKTICHDNTLAQYDAMLAKEFAVKKSDPNFRKDYDTWFQARNSCNDSTMPTFCLREKYASIFGLILNKYAGFSSPFIPDAECFVPLLPYENGDQGFYAVRVISPIRGCGDLNSNLSAVLEEFNRDKVEVKFLSQKNGVYYYQYNTHDDRNTSYKVGVKFDVRKVASRNTSEPTLVMSLVEAT